ncbi:hypothetical protein LDENG_00147420, partial [Lucifuga dentata]
VFQQLEVDRISMVRCALWDHCNHFSMQCVNDDEFYEEVRKVLEKCDITIDNNNFIEMKKTGTSPPEPIVFESYYQTEPSGDSNSKAHFAGAGDMMNSSQPTEASSGQLVALTENIVYETMDGNERAAPVATLSADENSYMVLYDYAAQEEDELSLTIGDVVQVLEQGDDGWWTAERKGQIGLVPGPYLAKI